jgi:hypothetical protein
MNCEEFEAIGLGSERDATLTAAERTAAREHASTCSHCAAVQDSWHASSAELRLFGEATQSVQTPARVEMRLRQEYRSRYRSVKVKRRAVIAAWALATAAMLVGAMSWENWRATRKEDAARHSIAAPFDNRSAAAGGGSQVVLPPQTISDGGNSQANRGSKMLVEENDMSDFTLLPGSMPEGMDEAAVVRVRMQRGSLGALGLPVNEESAGEWIQVELLVGNDGLPQAVRLPQ